MTTIAYKAFNDDFTCRSFQYEVGKTYTHDGEISMCDAGFHACENPLDVLNYYNLCDSRFAVVELSGEILTHEEEDPKLCAATLHVRNGTGDASRHARADIRAVIEKAEGAA